VLGAITFERVGAACAKDGSTELADAFYFVAAEWNGVVFDNTAPTVPEAYKVKATHTLRGEDDCTDDSIETGGIATAGENSNTHVSILGPSRTTPIPSTGLGIP